MKLIYCLALGILMIWAWVLLAATAIFYARFTRPAYVTGQWFEVCVNVYLIHIMLCLGCMCYIRTYVLYVVYVVYGVCAYAVRMYWSITITTKEYAN